MPKAWLAFSLALLFLTAAPFLPQCAGFRGRGTQLVFRCEGMTEPLGIDITHPRLSWQLQDSRRGARQTAYEVRVASFGRGAGAGSRRCLGQWQGRFRSIRERSLWRPCGRISPPLLLAGAGLGRAGPAFALQRRHLVGDGTSVFSGLESQVDHPRHASGARRLRVRSQSGSGRPMTML